MKHKDRCELGKIAKLCEERKKVLEFDDKGRLIKFKMYCKAKDFKKIFILRDDKFYNQYINNLEVQKQKENSVYRLY